VRFVNRFLMWLAKRSPVWASVLAGGMPPAGRDKYLDHIEHGDLRRSVRRPTDPELDEMARRNYGEIEADDGQT
jgi:hypothetical protein